MSDSEADCLTCSTLCRGSSQTVAKVVFSHVQNCHGGRIPPKSLVTSFRDPLIRRVTACTAEKSGLNRSSSILSSLQKGLGQLKWHNGCNSTCKSKLFPACESGLWNQFGQQNSAPAAAAACQDLKKWKGTCMQMSILDAILGILKLVGTLLFTLLQTIFNLLKSLVSAKANEKLGKYKEQVSPHLQKGLEATKTTMDKEMPKIKSKLEQEIPKIKSKLEQEIPLVKKNLQDFSSRVKEETKDAKTASEKQAKFFGVFGESVKSSKPVQIFLITIFIYFVWSVLKFVFW